VSQSQQTPQSRTSHRRQQRQRALQRRRNAIARAPTENRDAAGNWDQPLWPAEEFEDHHCEVCHFRFEGAYHWDCKRFPGLDATTCPTCNPDFAGNPQDINPWLSLIDNPLLVATVPLIKYLSDTYYNLDYIPARKRFLVELVIIVCALVLAKYI
jgi:hypothetical protein